MKGHSNNNIKPTLWDSGSGFNVREGDLLSGFPWPPRSYTCSFCKREFRSAQALGGHMNVHRRDRARQLRQSPPRDNSATLLNLNVKPNHHNNPLFINPNPSFSSSSPSPKTSPFSKFPPPAASSVSSASATHELKKRLAKTAVICNHFNLPKDDRLMKKKATKQLFGVEDMGCLKHETKCSTLMKKKVAENVVTLDLEIGLFSGKKQDLDLELRLGCS